MAPVLFAVVIIALVVVMRHFAARRVAAGQGQFVWLWFAPMLIAGVVTLWVSISMLTTVPIVGVGLTIGAGLYLAFMLRFLTRVSRSVSAAEPHDDIVTAMFEPIVGYFSSMMWLVLVGGVVAVVALIVWGISQAGR